MSSAPSPLEGKRNLWHAIDVATSRKPLEDTADSAFLDDVVGATAPSKPKKPSAKKKRSKSNYVKRNLQMISSALFISGAVGMIIVGAIRFSEMDQQTVHDVILNFYFLFLGVILAFHEFEVACVVSGFRFLQYHWGKCILCLFLCSISFSNNE